MRLSYFPNTIHPFILLFAVLLDAHHPLCGPHNICCERACTPSLVLACMVFKHCYIVAALLLWGLQ